MLIEVFIYSKDIISIHNRCTCKLIIKTTAAYVYANEQLRLCFDVLVRYSVVRFVQL